MAQHEVPSNPTATGEPAPPGTLAYAVVATYARDEDAERATEAARSAIPGAIVTIEPGATEPAAPALANAETPLIWRVIWVGFWWSIAGAILGALVGLAIGLAGVNASAFGDSVALEIASWAMFLHIAGAIIGIYISLNHDEAWGTDESSRFGSPGTEVRIESENRADTNRAERLLWDAGAESVSRCHADGDRQTWVRSSLRR